MGDDDTVSMITTSTKTSFAQTEQTCYCCGKKGHIAPNCSKWDTIPKSEWYIKRAVQHLQTYNEQQTEENDDEHSIESAQASTTSASTSSN